MNINGTGDRKKDLFMEMLVLQMPEEDPQILERIVHAFANFGHNLEEFNYNLKQIGLHNETLKQRIISIAAAVLHGADSLKRKAQDSEDDPEPKRQRTDFNQKKRPLNDANLPEAKRQCLSICDAEEQAFSFLEQLVREGMGADGLDGKVAHFIKLLSSESLAIVDYAWTCLSHLKKFENFKAVFCKKENIEALISLLEIRINLTIAGIAQSYLSELKKLSAEEILGSKSEQLSTYITILERMAKTSRQESLEPSLLQRICSATLPQSLCRPSAESCLSAAKESSHNQHLSCLDRLMGLFFSKSLQKSTLILHSIDCLAEFTMQYQNDCNEKCFMDSFSAKSLVTLFFSEENERAVLTNICLQVAADWNEIFIKTLQSRGVSKVIYRAIWLLNTAKTSNYRQAVFNYVHKLHRHFYEHSNRNPVFAALSAMLFNCNPIKDLPTALEVFRLLDSIEEKNYSIAFSDIANMKAMQFNCNPIKGLPTALEVFRVLDSIEEKNYSIAFSDIAKVNFNEIQSHLKKYYESYQLAIEMVQNEQMEDRKEQGKKTVATLEGIVLFFMQSIVASSIEFAPSFTERQQEIYISMLKGQPRGKITIAAARYFAAEPSNLKEIFQENSTWIGLQGVEALVELLTDTNEDVVFSALEALTTLARSRQHWECLLKTNAFEYVKALLQNPKDVFMGKALFLWGNFIFTKGEIDDTDLSIIQKRLFPAFKGRHIHLSIKTLNLLLATKGFPQALGREILETVTSLLKSKEDGVVEMTYWCLPKLCKLGLAHEMQKGIILEQAEKLLSHENTPLAVIEAVGFCLSVIVVEFFQEKSFQNESLCFISRCFNIKYPKIPEMACFLAHKLALKNKDKVAMISHATFAKGMTLLESPNEETTVCAMYLAEILCPLPYNYDSDLLKKSLDLLIEWLQKGKEGTQIRVLRLLEVICVTYKDIASAAVEKGVLLNLLSLLLEKESLHETLLPAIASLAHDPATKPPLKRRFNEAWILSFLRPRNSIKVREAMISIFNEIIEPNTFVGERKEEAIQLMWPSGFMAKGYGFYDKNLCALAKLLSREEIIKKLQNKTNKSKEDFLLCLSIISKQVSAIPTAPNTALQPLTSSPYKNWYAPYGKSEFSDIILQVGNTTLHCHKIVLAAQCGYFKHLLSARLKEAQDALIKVEGEEPEIFKKIIQFIYAQQCEFASIEEAFQMVAMADKYFVANLEAFCISFLISKLSAETAKAIYLASLEYPSIELKNQVMQWMMRYYLHLPEALQMHIQDDDVWPEFCELLTVAEAS